MVNPMDTNIASLLPTLYICFNRNLSSIPLKQYVNFSMVIQFYPTMGKNKSFSFRKVSF